MGYPFNNLMRLMQDTRPDKTQIGDSSFNSPQRRICKQAVPVFNTEHYLNRTDPTVMFKAIIMAERRLNERDWLVYKSQIPDEALTVIDYGILMVDFSLLTDEQYELLTRLTGERK